VATIFSLPESVLLPVQAARKNNPTNIVAILFANRIPIFAFIMTNSLFLFPLSAFCFGLSAFRLMANLKPKHSPLGTSFV
jgi:hypothetical protein